MRPTTITRTYTSAVTNSIAQSQALGGAGNLVINGALASGGVATLVSQGYVTLTSGGNDSARTATLTGTSEEGWTITDAVALTNGSVATSAKSFKTVTQIAIDGAIATTIIAGNAQSGYSQWIVLDYLVPNQVTSIQCVVTGTINYTVQYTGDNVFAGPTTFPTAFSHPTAALVGATTTQIASVTTMMPAVRLLISSGSGSVRMVVYQQSSQ